MNEKQTLELIRKFIRNECSRAELVAVQALIRQGVDEALWQRALKAEQASIENEKLQLDDEHARLLYSRISQRLNTARPPRAGQVFVMGWKWTVTAAASVIFGYFVFTLWLGRGGEGVRELLVATQYHERRELMLDDSSQVWVNSKSTLRYPERFSQAERRVLLEGEAFFQVTRHPDRPFIVQAGPLSVKVLGTSFNVKSFSDDDQTVITLTTGKVQVQVSDGHTEEMTPGDQLVFHKADRRFYKNRVDAAQSSAWREGVLHFASTPLPEVSRALERWYGVHIRLADPNLESTRITFKQRDQGLKEILDVLAFTAHMTYAVKGDSVILSTR